MENTILENSPNEHLVAETIPESFSEPISDSVFTKFFLEVASLTSFTWRFFKEVFKPPYEFNELMKQSFLIGYKSLPLIGITGFIIGLVLTIQSRPTLGKFGAESWLPAMVAVSIIREIGPVITALIFAGKVGSGIGAELASMNVTEQIEAIDSGALQYNIVRIDGQRSVYVPVFKQGGDSNTITIVNGMKAAIRHLVDIPESLKTAVVFDQSVFVKLAIKNVSKEALIGLVLTGVMILVFLGSPRAMIAVVLSVPLSMVVCLLIVGYTGGSINTMILGGLALVFSRLIDNGVIVLENIFRHMEMGESPEVAAESGGTEVSMAVLAATFTTSIVFFPVTFFTGVSKYIFTPMALGVVLSIFASYFFAMTVVPLFCAKFIRLRDDIESGNEPRLGFFRSEERRVGK